MLPRFPTMDADRQKEEEYKFIRSDKGGERWHDTQDLSAVNADEKI